MESRGVKLAAFGLHAAFVAGMLLVFLQAVEALRIEALGSQVTRVAFAPLHTWLGANRLPVFGGLVGLILLGVLVAFYRTRHWVRLSRQMSDPGSKTPLPGTPAPEDHPAHALLVRHRARYLGAHHHNIPGTPGRTRYYYHTHAEHTLAVITTNDNPKQATFALFTAFADDQVLETQLYGPGQQVPFYSIHTDSYRVQILRGQNTRHTFLAHMDALQALYPLWGNPAKPPPGTDPEALIRWFYQQRSARAARRQLVAQVSPLVRQVAVYLLGAVLVAYTGLHSWFLTNSSIPTADADISTRVLTSEHIETNLWVYFSLFPFFGVAALLTSPVPHTPRYTATVMLALAPLMLVFAQPDTYNRGTWIVGYILVVTGSVFLSVGAWAAGRILRWRQWRAAA